jgi:hypothetical protein
MRKIRELLRPSGLGLNQNQITRTRVCRPDLATFDTLIGPTIGR